MNYIGLSKEISYALRHAPWEYELELDHEGWVQVQQLLDVLRLDKKWGNIDETDLVHMMEQSEKQRFEIRDGRIRAYYGHTLPEKIKKEASVPPSILYHGTARHLVENILSKGLKPMSRQYVHLSTNQKTAAKVGRRKDSTPILLKILAEEAFKDGVKFYYGNNDVWLADNVPTKFITNVGNYMDNKKGKPN